MKKTFKGSSFCNGAGGTNFHIGFCLRSIKGLKVPFWANCAIPSIWQRFSWEWGSGGPFRLRVRCGGEGGVLWFGWCRSAICCLRIGGPTSDYCICQYNNRWSLLIKYIIISCYLWRDLSRPPLSRVLFFFYIFYGHWQFKG